MARAHTVGNGNILVGFDHCGQVRDFYYPYVGQSNHVSGASGNYTHRIGVYVDDTMSWFSDDGWDISIDTERYVATGAFSAYNEQLQIKVETRDVVHNETNVLLRYFTVHNLATSDRTIKLMLSQQFRIHESRRGDTGMYDPRVKSIIHYKGDTAFLVHGRVGEQSFSEYNIGLFGIEGKEGTYYDAFDGELSGNPIEHGSVDSVIALPMSIPAGGSAEAEYWVAVGASVTEVHDIHRYVLEEQPARLIKSTESYWRAWVTKEPSDTTVLPADLEQLYYRSLVVMRMHTGNNGAIIASSDTDMLHHGRDTYSYVWPRDGAMIAHAFDSAGYGDVSKEFFTFITKQLERGGYLMHKYCADGSLGSSWHPWIIDGKAEFPIQEDETALVLFMLYQNYLVERDIEFVESIYNTFIEPAAEFMVEFMESRLGLPQSSFDLWEEQFAISTFTASAVYGALTAAERFAEMLGKEEPARVYRAVAQRVQTSILEHLYDKQAGFFIKNIRPHDDREDERGCVLDSSSFYGPLLFGVVEPDDERLVRTFQAMEERLAVQASSAGYIRYEGDNYYKMHDADSPNPWVVTTMWVAQYLIAIAQTEADLERPLELLHWTASHTSGAGMLAEQMHPYTRKQLSTAPLVWSHAEYVLAVQAYLRKRVELIQNDSSTTSTDQ